MLANAGVILGFEFYRGTSSCWFFRVSVFVKVNLGTSTSIFGREDQSNHAVQRSQIHGGKPSPDGGRLHQIDEIQGLLRSCWSNSGFLGIWVRVRQAGTDADGFDCRNDWLDLCRFGRIAGYSRSIDGIQRKRKGGEAIWCSPQSTRAYGGSGSSIPHRYRPSIHHHQASS